MGVYRAYRVRLEIMAMHITVCPSELQIGPSSAQPQLASDKYHQ
jgi:hypothetical protein